MVDKKKANQLAVHKKMHVHDIGGDAQRLRFPAQFQDTFTVRTDLNIIMMPAARVKELREHGLDVRRQLITLADDQGRLHHGAALYYLSCNVAPPKPRFNP